MRGTILSTKGKKTEYQPIPAPSLYCVLRTFTHTPHHTGWHTRRRFGLLSEAYWFVRALGPISGCRGSHGGSGGTDLSAIRERIVTLHRPRSRSRGAAADRRVTAPLRLRTGSSEPCSSLSLDHRKTTVSDSRQRSPLRRDPLGLIPDDLSMRGQARQRRAR